MPTKRSSSDITIDRDYYDLLIRQSLAFESLRSFLVEADFEHYVEALKSAGITTDSKVVLTNYRPWTQDYKNGV